MRIIRYLRQAKGAVALIALLLIVQAFADLSLPKYTSDLVDVGIQQAGVEDASPQVMRGETFELACMMAPVEDEQVIRGAYERQSDGSYALTDNGAQERDSVNQAIAKPLAFAYFMQMNDEAPVPTEISGFSVENIVSSYRNGSLSKEQVLAAEDELTSQLDGFDESLIEQQAIAAVRAEYEALDYDAASIQMNYLVGMGLRMLGVAAVMMIASVCVTFVASRAAARIAANLRRSLFERVVSFSDAEVQKFSAASLITRGTNDIQQIQMTLTMLLRMVLYAPILAIGGIFMISQTDASMSWIIALAIAIIAVVIVALMAIAMPKFKMVQQLIDRVNLVSREILTGLPVIRAFDRQQHEEQRFDEANTRLFRTQLFTNRVMTFMMPTMMLVMNGVSVLIVWAGGHAIDSGQLQTGDMIAFITYSMVIIMSFLILGMMSVMLPRAAVAAQRVDEVLETQSSIEDPAYAETLKGTEGAEIAFDHVTFAYDDSSDPVLEDITFTAAAGKTTAIIGPTGSGKSTVVKLIERFYDVSSGSITVDGVDVRDVTQHDLRAALGYVPQKAFLFKGTVESSITCGREDISHETVLRSAEIAHASGFIADKEDGYDAEIAQGGTNVSGGQRQRLAIARALATDARALLFDDSFSALDYKTDSQVRAALAEHLGGRTMIIVAQRIATVMNADLIVVLEDGKVVGQGTHETLLSTCSTYREIAESQLSAEELGIASSAATEEAGSSVARELSAEGGDA